MALSRRILGREDEVEWNVLAGRVEDDEWKVDATPARRGLAGEILLSSSGFESTRVVGGVVAEDDNEGVEAAELPSSVESTCVRLGRV